MSKRSRMRKKNMPKRMKAISTEKATLISTTSGMPLTPTAASTRPFSRDMNPTTWVTAFRRVIITRKPMSTTESAIARVSRVSAAELTVTGSTSRVDSATSPTPASMVGPMPTAVSTVRWMSRRRTIQLSASGAAMALNRRASAAVR